MNNTAISFGRESLRGWLRLSTKVTLIALAVWLVILVINLAFGSVLLVALLFLADVVIKFLIPVTLLLALAVVWNRFTRPVPKD